MQILGFQRAPFIHKYWHIGLGAAVMESADAAESSAPRVIITFKRIRVEQSDESPSNDIKGFLSNSDCKRAATLPLAAFRSADKHGVADYVHQVTMLFRDSLLCETLCSLMWNGWFISTVYLHIEVSERQKISSLLVVMFSNLADVSFLDWI